MKAEKFVAQNSAEALRLVRTQLGPNAVILSNRSTAAGVEVIAMSEADLSALAELGENDERAGLTSPSKTSSFDSVMRSMSGEMKSLRGLLEDQLAGLTLNDAERHDPIKAAVWREILNLGFSPALLRKLLEHMPADCDRPKAMRWVRAALARNIATLPQDLVERGGVYALVGPTGVGKTTTVAKLAARCMVRHGSDSLALVTTDNYRIGAFEQLRIYADILGAPIFAVQNEAQLEATLGELSSRHLVLIDTAGMNQRDLRLADQISMLCGEGLAVKRILVLAATAQGITLEDVVRGFGSADLFGCILTKLDESPALGAILDVIIRHRLRVLYVTDGQRVPEDILQADVNALLERVFSTPPQGAFALRDAEYRRSTAATVPPASRT